MSLTELFTNIANAIRTKKGTTDLIPAQNFASEIESIESAGSVGSNLLPSVIDGSATEITAEDLDGATKIRDYGVYNHTALAEVTLPSSITSIGKYAFYNCTALTGVTLSSSTSLIGDYAFYGCSKLKIVNMGNGVTTINTQAFGNCGSLVSITIPSNVTKTSTKLFYNCRGLRIANIHLTTFSTKISSYSNSWFNGCSNSSLILHIPSSVTNPTTAYGTYWNYYASGSTITYYADL